MCRSFTSLPKSLSRSTWQKTIRHFEARTTLYETLNEAFEDVSVGSDQFVYYDSTNPKKCLAPDVFVKLDSRDRDFDSWMAWVRGTPDLAVEIVSDSDRLKLSWEEKFARYEAVGIQEVVRFDPRRDNAATACRAQTVRGSRCASTSGGGGQATACRSGTTA